MFWLGIWCESIVWVKICKYEIDPATIVEDTERTRFCPQMDWRTDGQGKTSIPPYQLRWSGGYNNGVSGVFSECRRSSCSLFSDNGLVPLWHQAIILTNNDFASIALLRTDFNEKFIDTYKFWLRKLHLKLSSIILQKFCPGEIELTIVMKNFSQKKYLYQFCVILLLNTCSYNMSSSVLVLVESARISSDAMMAKISVQYEYGTSI